MNTEHLSKIIWMLLVIFLVVIPMIKHNMKYKKKRDHELEIERLNRELEQEYKERQKGK